MHPFPYHLTRVLLSGEAAADAGDPQTETCSLNSISGTLLGFCSGFPSFCSRKGVISASSLPEMSFP